MRFSPVAARPHRARTGAAAFAAFALGGLTAVLTAPPAAAQSASFTSIADSTSPEFADFSSLTPINPSGLVAFEALRDRDPVTNANRGQGIYRSTGAGAIETVVLTQGNTEVGIISAFGVDSDGTVAFSGIRRAAAGGGYGLYSVAPGGGQVTLARTDTNPDLAFISFPSIRAGQVTFAATNDVPSGQPQNEGGIYRVPAGGGAITALVRTDTSAELATLNYTSGTPALPAASASGAVAFWATREAAVGGGQGIYLLAPGASTPTLLARTDTSPEFAELDIAPGINGAGTAVTFSAARDAGGQGVYLASGGSVSTLITTADPLLAGYSALYGTGVNDAGTVVFAADAVDAQNFVTGTGIFAALPGGSGPFSVLRTGDDLFGSTVTELVFIGATALNDNNQIAFRYRLANGTIGVARADLSAAAAVPEPGTLALLPIGALALAGAGAVRRRKAAAAVA